MAPQKPRPRRSKKKYAGPDRRTHQELIFDTSDPTRHALLQKHWLQFGSDPAYHGIFGKEKKRPASLRGVHFLPPASKEPKHRRASGHVTALNSGIGISKSHYNMQQASAMMMTALSSGFSQNTYPSRRKSDAQHQSPESKKQFTGRQMAAKKKSR